MQKDNSFRKAFYHLKMAQEYFEDTTRQVPASVGGKLSKKYAEKVKWIENDFNSNPQMPRHAIQDFKEEMIGDIMFHEAISLTDPLEISQVQEQPFSLMVKKLYERYEWQRYKGWEYFLIGFKKSR